MQSAKVHESVDAELQGKPCSVVSTPNDWYMFLFLLGWFLTDLRLELDELLRNLVVASLPKNSKNRPASLVFWYAFEQRKPSGTRTLKMEKFGKKVSFWFKK